MGLLDKLQQMESTPKGSGDSLLDKVAKLDYHGGSVGDDPSSLDVSEHTPYTQQVFDNEQQNLRRAQGQSSWEQGRRAIGKGLSKGALTFVENVGYLTDVEDMLTGIDTLDDASGNAIVQWAKESKASIDEAFPIYRESQDTWD